MKEPVWHHAGSCHFSPWHTYPEPRIFHDENTRLEGLTRYPSGALTSGCSSIEALVRHSEEPSSSRGHCHLLLQPRRWPGPAAWPGTSAGALHHIPFFLSSLSLSSLLSLFLSPAVPWFHQLSEGHPASRAAPVPALCGLNF